MYLEFYLVFFSDFSEEPPLLQILLMEFRITFIAGLFSMSDLLKRNPKFGPIVGFSITDSERLFCVYCSKFLQAYS